MKSKHLLAVYPLCWFLLLLLVVRVAAQDIDEAIILTVVNQSELAICDVRIMPATAQESTENILHDETLAVNTEHTINITRGVYHIGLWDCAGSLLYLWSYLSVSQPMTLVYPKANYAYWEQAVELKEQGLALFDSRNYSEALAVFQQMLAIYRDVGDSVGESETLIHIGHASRFLGQYDQALDVYSQALAIQQENDDRIGEGDTLIGIGLLYQLQGKNDEALNMYLQALTITQETGNQFSTAAVLNNIGDVYRTQGLVDLAYEYYTQALAIREALDDRVGQGLTLHNLGLLHQVQSEFDEALTLYDQALAIQRGEGDLSGEALTLTNAGIIQSIQGEYNQALNSFSQALEIQRRIGNHGGQGLVLSHLGGMYLHLGQQAQGLEMLNQALDLQREFGGPVPDSRILASLGRVYAAQGQYNQALEYFNEALEIQRKAGDRLGESNTLDGIARIYKYQGESGLALELFNQALVIQREINDRVGEANSLVAIAGLRYYHGSVIEALNNLNAALQIFRQVNNQTGESQTLIEIGNLYRSQGETDQALVFYENALRIREETGNLADQGWTLNWIAEIYSEQGQLDLAETTLNQALEIHTQTGNQEGESGTLVGLGLLAWKNGNPYSALELLNQGIMLREVVGDKAGLLIAQGIRALLFESLGQSDRAISEYQNIVEISEGVVSGGLLDSAVSSLSEQFHNRVAYQRLSVLLAQKGDLSTALDYAERGRAILIRNELQSGEIDFRAGADQSLLQYEQDLRLRLQGAQTLVDSLTQDLSASAKDIQTAQGALENARREYDQHLEIMQLQGGYLEREVSFQTATLDQIQAIIPPDSTLLVYTIVANIDFSGRPDIAQSIVFMVTSDDLKAVILNVTAEDIEALNASFAVDRISNTAVLRDFYDYLIVPIAGHLSTSRLIISPDGPLNYIPFAALQAPDGRYLIDDYAISMIPSATSLVLLNQRIEPLSTSPALVLAQPSAPGFPLLVHAGLEALDIADLFAVTPNLDASETFLRQTVSGSEVLHISAHAELNGSAPLHSVIHLGQDAVNDGRLEVREVYSLDLGQGTNLVVLSGCETGSGGNGEDFGLLNRAFLAAGARQVVSSLWQVDDAATAELLVAFMQERVTHANADEALQTAMLATRERYPQPYYWAGFALNGLPNLAIK